MRKIKVFSLFSVMLLTAVGLIGCNTSKEHHTRTGETLYREMCQLIRSYTDSLQASKDTVSFKRLSSAYEDKMTKLNFRYPADTDLELTEAENDTLNQLMTAYLKVRDSHLKDLHLTKIAIEGKAQSDSTALNK